MLKSHEREKLVNAIIFFAGRTKYCGKIKLIKMLYLLDFAHFRQTGRSVTGLEYHAWRMGPVPIDFFQEWDDFGDDLAQAIDVVPKQVFDFVREQVVPKRHFDDSHFTPRELRLMDQLAERFGDDYSKPLINVTHDERGPWSAIWDDGRGQNQRIPYQLAIPMNAEHREELIRVAAEYRGIVVADRASS